jgi:hypothetical protein
VGSCWLKPDQLAKQPYSTINARAETIRTAPTYGIKLPELSEVLFSQWYAEFWRLDRFRVAHAFLSLSIRHDLTTARRRLPSLVASRACGRA